MVVPLVTDIIVSGMEAYVPFSIKIFSPSKPWFDHVCYLAVQARERAFRSYRSSRSALTHAALSFLLGIIAKLIFVRPGPPLAKRRLKA